MTDPATAVTAALGERAERDIVTLLEALPYIREFHGRTVVIKYGGAAMIEPDLKEEFARDVALLKYVGINPVIVHGGGPEITAYMKRLNLPVEFVDGLRVSNPATVEVAKMVLVGKVNKDIVLRLGRHGQPAVGLCGDDGLMFTASRQLSPSGADIGFVGRIDSVDTGVLLHVAQDYIPVIASVGADADGHAYNINADAAAGAVASALGAYKAMFLTDVAGWLRDPSDPTSLVAEATAAQLRRRAAVGQRWHAAEARGVPAGGRGRRPERGDRRRTGAAFTAARALHRCGSGHDDPGRRRLEMSSPTAVPTTTQRSPSSKPWSAPGSPLRTLRSPDGPVRPR